MAQRRRGPFGTAVSAAIVGTIALGANIFETAELMQRSPSANPVQVFFFTGNGTGSLDIARVLIVWLPFVLFPVALTFLILGIVQRTKGRAAPAHPAGWQAQSHAQTPLPQPPPGHGAEPQWPNERG